jgi:hypothetical protein
VIANPPYMGGKGMNGRLAVWLKDNYEDVKSDLFSAFIVRNTEMTLAQGPAWLHVAICVDVYLHPTKSCAVF